MIKLKNIVIDGNIIKCDIFPEDSEQRGTLEVDIEQKSASYVLPDGYEWCINHIEHAKNNLIRAYNRNDPIPKQKIIMWH